LEAWVNIPKEVPVMQGAKGAVERNKNVGKIL